MENNLSNLVKIHVLPLTEMRIIKDLTININQYVEGHVKYARILTNDYKMKESPNESVDNIEICLFKQPEANYPNDSLDKLICEALKYEYGDVCTRSSLMFFDSERERLRSYRNNMLSTVAHIYCTPQISIQQMNEGDIYTQYMIPIEFYSYNKDAIKELENKEFNLEYPYKVHIELEKRLSNLCNTYSCISQL